MAIPILLWTMPDSITWHSLKTVFQRKDSSRGLMIMTNGLSNGDISIFRNMKIRWKKRKLFVNRSLRFYRRNLIWQLPLTRVRVLIPVVRLRVLAIIIWKPAIMVSRTWSVWWRILRNGQHSLMANMIICRIFTKVRFHSFSVIVVMCRRIFGEGIETLYLGWNPMIMFLRISNKKLFSGWDVMF